MDSYKNFFAYISPICREAPLEQIYMKFCMRGHLADVINITRYQLVYRAARNQMRHHRIVPNFISIRSGVLILWGVEFLAFP